MRALSLALMLAVPAASEEMPLAPDALLDRLVGTTSVFTSVPGGARVGIEYFPSRTRSFWQRTGGVCVNGEMTVEDGFLCFRYEDQPGVLHCWAPFVDEDELFVRSARSGQVQRIESADGLPFDCVDGLTS